MAAGIILENGIKMEIGNGVTLPLPRLLEVSALALTSIGDGHYFLAAVTPEAKGDNMMSPADRALGLYGVVVEAVRGDGKPRLYLSAQFPTATLRRLRDERRVV